MNKPLKHLSLAQNNETAQILLYRVIVELNKLLKHFSQAQNYKTGEILLYRLIQPEQPNLGTAPPDQATNLKFFHSCRSEQPPSIVWHFPIILNLRFFNVKKTREPPLHFLSLN